MEPIIKADLENIIINLLQKCQLEGETPMQIPLEDVERRVLHYSEISRNKLEIAIGRYSSTKCRINHCVDFGKHILEPSTRGMNYYHFIHNMNMIGIDHQTIINGKMLLMEDPKITFERSLFLNKMKKIRQSDLMIYYVSERIIDDKCNFEKPWVRNCKTLKLFTNGHVDRVIKANGHHVVRLPTHFEDLSPIDQIWQDIKKFQSLSQADLHNSILKYFLEIPTVVYTQLYDKVVKKENTLIELDDKIEHALDEFLKELKITEIVLE
ncbi:hypothetical protein SFRURICE_020330 [Spodoptera frugiperda]|nr:hypothetical protein SFRURICE_020330 [Spodoptera frugiperda]